MQTPINIIDLPCGNGKTTKMIDSFVEDTSTSSLSYLSKSKSSFLSLKLSFSSLMKTTTKDHTNLATSGVYCIRV